MTGHNKNNKEYLDQNLFLAGIFGSECIFNCNSKGLICKKKQKTNGP
jgi:hypothetical protein